MSMPKSDPVEREVLDAYDQGRLKSVATKGELARFKAAARATGIKDRRVNIRLSSGDLSDIQTRALEEGIPPDADCQRPAQIRHGAPHGEGGGSGQAVAARAAEAAPWHLSTHCPGFNALSRKRSRRL